MSRIFLTGGSGFLGSFVAYELLKRKHEVIFLARNKKDVSAKERINNALRFVDAEYEKYFHQYKVVDGDVSLDNLGLSDHDLSALSNLSIEEVWHIAGSVSFSEKDRDLNYSVNVYGTNQLLGLLSQIKPKKLFHVSTAFICGKNESAVYSEDQLDCGQIFNNSYEETKYISEQSVRDWSLENPETATAIFRPSIIVGDSKTGKTNNFTGYYRYMRVYHVIKNRLSRNKAGSFTQKNGHFFLPISVPGISEATLDIIPIDYAVDLMINLRSQNALGAFHITADNPSSYIFWLREGLRILGISGVKIGKSNGEDRKQSFLDIEKQIKNGLADYIPYITGKPIFDKTKTKEVLGNKYTESPSATPELIERLLSYAIENDFKYLVH
jgi:nucleoside-diphosphate-sugar epimerase